MKTPNIKIQTEDGTELKDDDTVMGMKCEKFKGFALILAEVKITKEIIAGFENLKAIRKRKAENK